MFTFKPLTQRGMSRLFLTRGASTGLAWACTPHYITFVNASIQSDLHLNDKLPDRSNIISILYSLRPPKQFATVKGRLVVGK